MMRKNYYRNLIHLILTLITTAFIAVPVCAGNTAAEKTVTALGTGSMINPTSPETLTTPWTGNYVYYGKYNGNPVKYRVMDKNSQGDLFLDCDTILYDSINRGDSWESSFVKAGLTGDKFWNKDGCFTDPEKAAVSEVTLLDSFDVGNIKYGYTYDRWDGNAIKSDTDGPAIWWLRSPGDYVEDHGRIGSMLYPEYHSYGVSPALKIKLSSILYASPISGTSGEYGTEYKLTLKDTVHRTISPNTIIRNDSSITVFCDKDRETDHISLVITDKDATWTENDGWSSEATLHYYKTVGVDVGETHSVTEFVLPDGFDGHKSDWRVYLVPEKEGREKEPDLAGKPQLITVPEKSDKTGIYFAEGLAADSKTYDGKKSVSINGIPVMKNSDTDETISGITAEDIIAQFEDKNAGSGKNVSIVSAVLKGTNASDYYFDANKSTRALDLKADITAKPTSISWNSTSVPYTGQSQHPAVTAEGVYNGDVCDVIVEGSETDVNEEGTHYTARVTGLSNSNYLLQGNNLTIDYTIVKADVTMSGIPRKCGDEGYYSYKGYPIELIDKYSIEYEGGTMYVAVTDDGTAAPEFDGTSESDNKKWRRYSSYDLQEKNAGTYYVWYMVKGDRNHNDTKAALVENSGIVIEKKPIHISVNDQLVFINTPIRSDASLAALAKDPGDVNDLVDGDHIDSVSLNSLHGTEKAGSFDSDIGVYSPDTDVYSVVIKNSSGEDVTANYNITKINKGKLTVASDQVYIAAGIFANGKTYDRTVTVTEDLTVSPNDLKVMRIVSENRSERIENATVTDIVAEFSDANAGQDKTVNIVSATVMGPDSTPYFLNCEKTNEALDLRADIAPRQVTIFYWSNYSFTYDGLEHCPVPGYVMGVEYGDDCTVTVSGGQINASDEPYTASAVGLSNSNYVLSDFNSTTQFYIYKADIDTDCIIAPTAETGLVYSGSSKSLIKEGSVTGAAVDMYYTTSDSGTLAPEFDGTSDAADKKWKTSVPAATDAGTYYVWYKVTGDGNHNDTDAICVDDSGVKIGTLAATVTASPQTVSENESISTDVSQAVLSGAVKGDFLDSVTLSTDRSTAKAGKFDNAITASGAVIKNSSGKDVTANYDITYNKGTLTVKSPGEPDPVNPDPVDPNPVDPDPVDPNPVDPNPVNPGPVDPNPVDPNPVNPGNVVDNGKVPTADPSEKYASSEDNLAPSGSPKKITAQVLDFSKVAGSSVDPGNLRMTAISGSKFITSDKLRDRDSVRTEGGVKAKVNKKTLVASVTCRSDGSATFIMADGNTYTVHFRVQKPKAQKSEKNLKIGSNPVVKTIWDLFKTNIDSGTLSIEKQKHSQASLSGNAIVIDPREKDNIKLRYKYLNKNYRITIKVK